MKDRTKDFEAVEQAFEKDPASFKAYEAGFPAVIDLIQSTQWASNADFRSACATPRLGHGLLLQAAALTKDPPQYRIRALELCKKAMRNLPDEGFRHPWWQDAVHYVSLIALCQWQALELLTSGSPPESDVLDLHVLAKLLAKIRLYGFRYEHLSEIEWSQIDPTGLFRRILDRGHHGSFDPADDSKRILQLLVHEADSPLGQWFEVVMNRPEGNEVPISHETFLGAAIRLYTPGRDSEEDESTFRSIISSNILEAVISTSPWIYSVLLELAKGVLADDEERDEDGDEQFSCHDLPAIGSMDELKAFAREIGLDVEVILDELRDSLDTECSCPTCTANRRILMEVDGQSSSKGGGRRSNKGASSKSVGEKPSGRVWRPKN